MKKYILRSGKNYVTRIYKKGTGVRTHYAWDMTHVRDNAIRLDDEQRALQFARMFSNVGSGQYSVIEVLE